MRQILAVAAVVGLLTAGCAKAEETPAPQINATADSVEIPEAGSRSTDPEPRPPAGDTSAASQPGGDPVGAASDDSDIEPAGTAPDISEPAGGDPVGAASDDSDIEPAGTAPDISEPAGGDPVGAASDDSDGDTADISGVEQEDGSAAGNAASMEPEAPELDETELTRAPQPVWHDGITAQDYFAELIPWMLDEDAPAVQACLTDAFVGSFSSQRLAELAAATADADLSLGFAAGLMGDDESEALVDVMAPCAVMSLQTALDPGSPFRRIEELLGGAPQASTPEIQEVFAAGIAQCFTDLAAQDGFMDLIVRSALFEDQDTDTEAGAAMFAVCSDSLIVPLIVESLVEESGIERDVAQCAMTDTYPALRDAVLGSPDQMEAALMLFGFQMMVALSECGASLEDLAG